MVYEVECLVNGFIDSIITIPYTCNELIIYTMGTNIICILIGIMIGSLFVTFTSPKSEKE